MIKNVIFEVIVIVIFFCLILARDEDSCGVSSVHHRGLGSCISRYDFFLGLLLVCYHITASRVL